MRLQELARLSGHERWAEPTCLPLCEFYWPEASITLASPAVEAILVEIRKGWQGLSTSRWFGDDLDLLERQYRFRRRPEVLRFLQENAFLIPLLYEAYGMIIDCFGPSTEVVLEVVTDPEIPDDRKLFAFVRSTRSASEILSGLEELDRRWWLSAMERAEGKLCIHIEF